MEPRRSKHFLAHIPTIALLVVFAMSPWLGILFFILRAIDRDAEKKEQENAEYSSDFRSQDTGAGQPARDTEPVYGHDVPTACLLYTSPSPRDGATSRMPSSA